MHKRWVINQGFLDFLLPEVINSSSMYSWGEADGGVANTFQIFTLGFLHAWWGATQQFFLLK